MAFARFFRKAASLLVSIAMITTFLPAMGAPAGSGLLDEAADISKTVYEAVNAASLRNTPNATPSPGPEKTVPTQTAPAQTPQASGKSAQTSNQSGGSSAKDPVIYKGDRSEIDATYKDDAYIKVRYTGTADKKLRVQIIYTSDKGVSSTYTYAIYKDGVWQTFNLQLGNGTYTVKVLENKSGNTYSVIQTQDIKVTYTSQFAPFLIPIQNINYSSTSKAVSKAKELTKGSASELEKVEAVYKYIVETVKYDYDKANDVKAGKIVAPYVPDVDGTYSSSKGICYDYSSLMAAMLRSIGIPTKLVTGNVSGGGAHAWNEVYINGTGWIKVQTQITFDGKNFQRMDSTFESSNTDGSLSSYIGDGANYVTKYIY